MSQGFLGAGKTTLLNQIVSRVTDKRVAVVENEYALAFGLERKLLSATAEGLLVDELYEFGNGCICCSLKGEFVQTLERLVYRKEALDLLIIELTGMADPGPVARIFGDPELAQHFRLDGIVTVVDAKHVQSHLQKGYYKESTAIHMSSH